MLLTLILTLSHFLTVSLFLTLTLNLSRGDRESDFLGFREASGLDTISRHFPAGIGKFVNI